MSLYILYVALSELGVACVTETTILWAYLKKIIGV
jgi:hypothetical protein